jgi:catalase
MLSSWFVLGLLGLSRAACPYMEGSADIQHQNEIRDFEDDADFLKQFTLDDSNAFITSDAGGPIEDSTSLKAGQRGPTLLEDFIFRQKIQHFDHERVCCRNFRFDSG